MKIGMIKLLCLAHRELAWQARVVVRNSGFATFHDVEPACRHCRSAMPTQERRYGNGRVGPLLTMEQALTEARNRNVAHQKKMEARRLAGRKARAALVVAVTAIDKGDAELAELLEGDNEVARSLSTRFRGMPGGLMMVE